MSYKHNITHSYSDEVYKQTQHLQRLKEKAAITKNQWIFLERCLFHHIVPKSLKNRPTLNTRKGYNITQVYNQRMLVATKNHAKQKYHKLLKEISTLTGDLHVVLDDSDFNTLIRITDRSRENIFIKERERLMDKFFALSGKKKKFTA